MVEPTTARQYPDESLGVTVDLSGISMIMTANDMNKVEPLLRARCRIVEMPVPRPADFSTLLKGIRRDIAAEFGAAESAVPPIPHTPREKLFGAFKQGNLSARGLAAAVREVVESRRRWRQPRRCTNFAKLT